MTSKKLIRWSGLIAIINGVLFFLYKYYISEATNEEITPPSEIIFKYN